MSKIFMIRHLERIDVDDASPAECRLWGSTHSKDPLFKMNPYIIKSENKLPKLVSNLNETGVVIDSVVCSPFLRCIETAVLLVNSSDKFKDKIINIDFNLSEFLNSDYEFQRFPLDVKEIYEHSKSYIQTSLAGKEYTLNELNTDLVMHASEEEAAYRARIDKVLKELRSKCSGNILIITHADAYVPYNAARQQMKHGMVYELDIPASEGAGGGYYKKYLKYKMKYLKLKNSLE